MLLVTRTFNIESRSYHNLFCSQLGLSYRTWVLYWHVMQSASGPTCKCLLISWFCSLIFNHTESFRENESDFAKHGGTNCNVFHTDDECKKTCTNTFCVIMRICPVKCIYRPLCIYTLWLYVYIYIYLKLDYIIMFNFRSTVYPKKYAHGFVVLCSVVVTQSFIMNSHEVFIHIHQRCFAGTGAIVRLPQCQWSKPDGYGKISQCITTTKHSKAKTVCIFLGIYCMV